MSRAMTLRLLLLSLVIVPAAAHAQRYDLSGGVSASTLRVARTGNSDAKLGGPVLGAGGTLRAGRFALDLRYLEGQLAAVSGSTVGDEVFAEASLEVRGDIAAGFSLGVGPRARAFIAPVGTVRWMRMEARARYESEVIPGRARADVVLWQVLSGDVNAQGGSEGGRGGTAGLTITLPNSRFALRLGYTADRVAFASGSSEFVDAVELGLRIGRH